MVVVMQNGDEYSDEDLEDLKNAIGLLAGFTERDKKNCQRRNILKAKRKRPTQGDCTALA
jgi:hypothetical protein